MSRPADVAATFCATVVDEWVRAGLTDVVICPGSRSTPMALAFAADGRVRVHVHTDERSAAFLALGLGSATGRPAAVLTTSGTAAVELHPAVVEAFEARVPLLACTADRPAELHGVGAPQTIDQQRLFGSAARWFVDVGVPDPAGRDGWRSLAARAHAAAVGPPAGPVHLNLPFREPLLGVAGDLPPGRPGGNPWHGRGREPGEPGEPETVDADALAAACRDRLGVIVAGAGIGDPDAVHSLADALGWPVLADPRSGCRTPRRSTIAHADAILRTDGLEGALAPEVVLRFGSLPASKVVNTWLAGLDAWQVGVERHGAVYDPHATLNARVGADPGALAAAMVPHLSGVRPRVDWSSRWAAADAEAAAAITAVLAAHREPTEPGTVRATLAALPDGGVLVCSSSMPIRDLEWYGVPREDVTVLANRGANGIDGVLSTAVGAALGTPNGPRTATAVLVGDLAFLHDSNGLLGAASRGIDLTVVVIDNHGGGIFEFLPQADGLDRARFEQLFGTPQATDLLALAAAHGATPHEVTEADAVDPTVRACLVGGGVHVVRVRTERRANVALHREIHDAVATALASAG